MGNEDPLHVFSRAVLEMVDLGLTTPEDLITLTKLLETLAHPERLLLRDALQHQPELQLASGYYANWAMARWKEAEEALEEMWHRHYRILRGSSEKRLTEAAVNSHVRGLDEYGTLKARCLRLKHLSDQLGELRDAYGCRARMLDQVSNNDRLAAKSDSEDDR